MSLHKLSRFSVVFVLAGAVVAASGCGGAQARKAKHMDKGAAFLAAGNFEKARVEFQNALQIEPKDGEARFENGVVDEKLGNIREAAQFYQGAIDINPEHLRARANLARLYLFSGAPDRALELIKPVIEKHPDDAQLLTIRAAVRLQQKDVSGAQSDAERAVQLAPDNEDAAAVLSGLYNSIGEAAKGRALLEQAIKRIPSSVDLRLALSQMYASENRQAESEAILVDLVRLRPSEKAHRIRLAQYYARLSQPDAAERTLREGIKLLPSERDLKIALIDFLAARRTREAAETELKAMIAAEPKDIELKFALAKLYENLNEVRQAEAVYRSVIDSEKLEAAGLTARSRLAALLALRNDTKGAEKLVNEALAKNPRDNDALILRGNIALANKDPKAAIGDLRAVLRDQPNATGVLRALARAHVANGEPAIAEETMRRAVEANPKDASVRLDFAQLLSQLGKAEQAKPLLAELVKQQPDNIAALDAQFRVGMMTKDLVIAKSAADGLVATRPTIAAGYLYQGMIAEAEKRADDALRLYTRATELQPEAPDAMQAQARMLVALRRLPDALKHLDELIARFPKSSVAPSVKGELLMAAGRASEAQNAFKIAIERTPKWWPPYRALAQAQLALKESDAAVATLRNGQSLVEQPDTLGSDLGSLLERLGKPDEAIRQYEEVVRRSPQSEVAANNLAMLLATYKSDGGSLDRAKDLASRFADSSNPAFLDTYGWVLYKRGETAAAVPVLERVVAKSPDAPLARYHLGMAQSKAGSTADARDNLTKAVKSGAKFSGLDEAKATLEKLATVSTSTSSAPKT
jgi:tetratricopeptide (TPR) repeat protein